MSENSPRRLVVNVTQEHIDKGVRGDGKRCPIAYALADEGLTAYVGASDVVFGNTGKRYMLSRRAQEFVLHFDCCIKPVKPSRFILTREG